nr:protein ROOT HAIR DEFECTIVE 3 homolog 1-like isoform X1 [Nicotiana tomentosiformis]XP_018631260.1 protein ROOT HAIR DEFECTIVE 3 homolog 1-like isoform X1 [Nicotiana tomentosiformis]
MGWSSKASSTQGHPLSEFFNKSLPYPVTRRRKSSLKIRLPNLGSNFYTLSLQEAWLVIGEVLFLPLGFLTAQQIWKVIKENKDLDLPAHKAMVATVRCEEIANEKFGSLMINEDCRALEHEVHEDAVRNFGR